jgi:Fe-S oxidoreductase
LAACEILDKHSVKVVEEALGRDVSTIEALLVMEADGVRDVVLRDMREIERICRRHNVQEFEGSDDAQKREEMMRARGGLVPTLSRIRPFCRLIPIAEDLGVPSTKIPEIIRRVQAIAEKHGVLIATFGHVGDGNVHTSFVSDVRSREDWDRLKAAADELVQTALEMRGTISAEHGAGLTRAPHVERQLGPGLEVMRKIKRALDPNNILNPGKMGLDRGRKDIYDHFAFRALVEHPERVNSFGEEIDNEILACIHCGFCRLGCPTFGVTHRESRDARGRNVLAFCLMDDSIEPSRELAEAFYSCTVCQACTHFCPAQIKVDEIVVAMREKLCQAGFLPEKVQQLGENVLRNGNIYASPEQDRIETYPSPLRETAREGRLKRRAETLLYLGCVPSYFDTKIVPSLLRSLDAADVDYTTLSTEEICCGFPLYLIGSGDFQPHAERLIGRIEATGARELVTPCAGCYKAFKKIYPEFAELGVHVYHTVHYLWRLIDEGRLKFGAHVTGKVTYHDPCDLGRGFKIFDEPRDILNEIPGLEYIEMARNRLQARCCGGGGGIQATHPQMATDMGAERLRDALAVGADIVVSACAACKGNMKKGARALPKGDRGGIKVMDITELVARAMK